ncbi:MAG: hypothetical protein HFE76_06110 [Firmicutes bacterium]|nr:hypothetical protein [Bacillota bacterium]
MVSSTKVGSTAQAVTASASGDKTTQLEFTLDPTKMKAGTTVTINGQTYEFILEEKGCSLQTEEGLCGLQLSMGAEALPDVCTWFPRHGSRCFHAPTAIFRKQ